MGTPEFAIPCLEALIDNYEVCGVVTQPDKPKGRGYVLTPPAIKVCALEHGIPVYQPETLKDGAFSETLNALAPDVIVVVAYGKILPSYVLDYPRLGCINVHGSLLPEYRGAAPMQRAIIDGKQQTGVTTMYMARGLDTGDMLEKSVCDITVDDNFESIHDKLSILGSKLIISTLNKLEKGEITPVPQDEGASTYAEKIDKSDCIIDFNCTVKCIHDRIRGLSPFPLSFAYLKSKMIKFVSSVIISEKAPSVPCGTVISASGSLIEIACQDGVIGISTLLPEGKKRMSAEDFIRGRQISAGDIFTSEKN